MNFKVLMGLIVLLLLGWVAMSGNSTQRRIAAINQAIKSKDIGQLPPFYQQRLENQVNWLMVAAGIKERFTINKALSRDHLNVIVTTPEYEEYTGCGVGNAIYNPKLDVIFIDYGLLVPKEIVVLGENSVHSMVDVKTLGFVVSYTNFILAHELAHRKLHREGGNTNAFFHYGLLGGSGGDKSVELAADREAVKTIVNGFNTGNIPAWLEQGNALEMVGLDHAELKLEEKAAAEILGGLFLMSKVLLFSSSPYSPYHFDNEHPSFISRSQTAINEVASTSLGKTYFSHSKVVVEDINRMNRLSKWQAQELYLGTPALNLVHREGALYLGSYRIPSERGQAVSEYLYRINYSDSFWSDKTTFEEKHLLAQAHTDENSATGQWFEQIMSTGSGKLNIPSAKSKTSILTVNAFNRIENDEGLAYPESAWQVTTDDGSLIQFEQTQLESLIKAKLGRSDLEIGQPQLIENQLMLPVSYYDLAAEAHLVFFELSVANTQLEKQPLFVYEVVDDGYEAKSFFVDALIVNQSKVFGPSVFEGRLYVESAIFKDGVWFVGVVPTYGEDEQNRWQLWQLSDAAAPVMVAETPFLVSFAGDEVQGSYLKNLDPTDTRTKLLSSGKLLVWHQNDSVFLFDPTTRENRIIFHPDSKGLSVIELNNKKLLFWLKNTHKVYIVDTNKAVSS